MKLSTDRILTTHVGSLPRPQEVVDLLFAQDRGEQIDEAQFNETMRRAVCETLSSARPKPASTSSATARPAKSVTPLTSATGSPDSKAIRPPHPAGSRRLSRISRPPGENGPLRHL